MKYAGLVLADEGSNERWTVCDATTGQIHEITSLRVTLDGFKGPVVEQCKLIAFATPYGFCDISNALTRPHLTPQERGNLERSHGEFLRKRSVSAPAA